MTRSQTVKPGRRLILSLAAMFFALGAGAANAQDVENVEIKTQVGQTLILKLPGQPNSGYRWRIITAESQGQELVDVRELGWTLKHERGYFTVRDVGILRYTVETKAAGKAHLVFEYRRMVPEPPRGRRRVVEINIAPDPNK